MAEISKISKGGVEYTIKDTQGRAETASLEERVFGKEVEWKEVTQVYDDSISEITSITASGLKPQKYFFAFADCIKDGKLLVDLSDITKEEFGTATYQTDRTEVGGTYGHGYRFYINATLRNGLVDVDRINVYEYDDLGDEFNSYIFQTPIPMVYTEYFEESMQDQITALDARVTALENASGGNGGGNNIDVDYSSWDYVEFGNSVEHIDGFQVTEYIKALDAMAYDGYDWQFVVEYNGNAYGVYTEFIDTGIPVFTGNIPFADASNGEYFYFEITDGEYTDCQGNYMSGYHATALAFDGTDSGLFCEWIPQGVKLYYHTTCDV